MTGRDEARERKDRVMVTQKVLIKSQDNSFHRVLSDNKYYKLNNIFTVFIGSLARKVR